MVTLEHSFKITPGTSVLFGTFFSLMETTLTSLGENQKNHSELEIPAQRWHINSFSSEKLVWKLLQVSKLVYYNIMESILSRNFWEFSRNGWKDINFILCPYPNCKFCESTERFEVHIWIFQMNKYIRDKCKHACRITPKAWCLSMVGGY